MDNMFLGLIKTAAQICFQTQESKCIGRGLKGLRLQAYQKYADIGERFVGEE